MKAIIILCTLLLTACSSIPLSTIIHFSDAKPDDFFTVDPKGILVKVSINSQLNFDPALSINLSASIKDSSGEKSITFPLEVVNKVTQGAVVGFFNNSPAINIYTLRLSPKAIANLEVLHRERTSGLKKQVGLTAGVHFTKTTGIANNNAGIDENTVLSVSLRLTENNEFITLIDNWKVGDELAKNQ